MHKLQEFLHWEDKPKFQQDLQDIENFLSTQKGNQNSLTTLLMRVTK